jgi:integrative and conjugative element protein (TIGR02256 family)
MEFKSPLSTQSLAFTEGVLGHFESQKQIGDRAEVGGQLFGKIVGEKVVVFRATGPYPEDTKRRYWFLPSRSREQKDIKALFKEGLHYVGDWHTHPVKTAVPSSVDIESMAECFRDSKHNHHSFVMVIVGTGPLPSSLSVTLHTDKKYIRLEPGK